MGGRRGPKVRVVSKATQTFAPARIAAMLPRNRSRGSPTVRACGAPAEATGRDANSGTGRSGPLASLGASANGGFEGGRRLPRPRGLPARYPPPVPCGRWRLPRRIAGGTGQPVRRIALVGNSPLPERSTLRPSLKGCERLPVPSVSVPGAECARGWPGAHAPGLRGELLTYPDVGRRMDSIR